MGQYYKPVQTKNLEWLYTHDIDDGLKLMEHSWLGNRFMQYVETLLSKGQQWYKQPLVWAGDYSDPVPGSKDEDENYYNVAEEKGQKLEIKTLPLNPPVDKKIGYTGKYLVNYTKQEYVDLSKTPLDSEYPDADGKVYHYYIHPLPLLTSDCPEKRGGGDYVSDDYTWVGRWCNDCIAVEDQLPGRVSLGFGINGPVYKQETTFKEIEPNFKETH